MLTGEEILEVAIQSLKEGADEFIIKSIDIYHLLPHIIERTVENYNWRKNLEAIENKEREKKVQIETLKRIMMTLAHHLNNGVMPIIFSAELCQRSVYNLEKVKKLVETSLRETQRINFIIERFERYIEDEEFKYTDYLDLKDAMFDVEAPVEQD
jgi:nitrogen-specific signal transduction histidine kinase